MILPVDSPSPDLCKIIVSMVALGYPGPVLVNRKKEFNTKEEGLGPSHLGKVTGALEYLEWATEQQELDDDDLVVMLDAIDIWLQLPPEVLLRRYLKSIQNGNRRLYNDGFRRSDEVTTRTIASAEKRCLGPRDPISQLHCDILPESPLSPSTYGPFTDLTFFGWTFGYSRPRYMNSGSFMGPAGDMKRYFGRFKVTMDTQTEALQEGDKLGGD